MSRFGEELARIMVRDLDRLAAEVEAYPTDEALWRIGGGVPNRGGTLALHLAGNLRHFVGAVLGGNGYARDREREFAARNLPRTELLEEIAAARADVRQAVPGLTDGDLDDPWPGRTPLQEGASTREMLVHLSGHLAYHLGQINYHRRFLAVED